MAPPAKDEQVRFGMDLLTSAAAHPPGHDVMTVNLIRG